jgi:tetratricopeptide (TPR) repeat protein
LELLQRVLGDRHPHTLDALANYGNFLRRRGDLAGAETVLRDVLERDIAARGPAHAFVGHDHANLANLLLDANQPRAAEEQFRAALHIYSQALPSGHPFVASALSGLGRAQFQQQRWTMAEQTLRNAIEMGTASLPADSAPLALAKSTFAEILLRLQRPQEARPLLEQSYAVLRAAHGEHAPATLRARELLAQMNAARTRARR